MAQAPPEHLYQAQIQAYQGPSQFTYEDGPLGPPGHIVEFLPEVKASKALQLKVAEQPNMTVTVNPTVKAFKVRNNRLAEIIVQDRATGEVEKSVTS